MAHPLVSVVIPAFNRAATIRSSVESVLRQTYSDIEVIVVDDGSTDDTVDAVSGIQDRRIILERLQYNQGVSFARNRGIELARGNIIAFQDSDDEWMPRKLELQMQRLESRQVDYVAAYCGMLVILDSALHDVAYPRTSVSYIPLANIASVDGFILPSLMLNSFVSTQTLVVRRDAFEKAGLFDTSLPALVDWDFVLRLAQLGSIAFVDEPLVIQRYTPNSITRSAAKRVAAHVSIVHKHRKLFMNDTHILAEHYNIIAGAYRRLGDANAAFGYLLRSMKLRPFRAHTWASFALTVLRMMQLWRNQKARG